MESLEIIKGKVSPSFWSGKKVFLTGHTGFKGSWLSLWLQNMGAVLKGYSLEINTNPALFKLANIDSDMESELGDIRNLEKLTQSMVSFNPDIIIHMAAQPLVRHSYEEPVETFNTNIMGTVNVLESARKCQDLKTIICITTDKCYENNETDRGYKEDDSMGGYDPYSSSKGCAELAISAYRRSFFSNQDSPSLASARAGNVIGGGDWADDRLIPDILRAFEKSENALIRNPLAIRPWQHVLEPLSGYLVLAQELFLNGDEFAEAWNFGPTDEDCKSVSWILDRMVDYWGNDVSWSIDDKSNPHEAGILKLDCSKASQRLQWRPKWNLEKTLHSIVNWHRVFVDNGDLRKESLNQIHEYIKDE